MTKLTELLNTLSLVLDFYDFLQHNGRNWYKVVKSGEEKMLIGQFKTKISPKGRVALPKKFREVLGDQLVITVGYEKALMIIAQKDWKNLIETSSNKPFIFDSARDNNRFLLGQATEVSLDDQGRFVLPSFLRTYAKIDQEAVFLGLNNYVEVWDKNSWEEYQKYLHEHSGEIAEKLGKLNEKRE